ncbi:MAG: PDDEXK nuclease domain-containing protein [Prevotella sp.]|nr:PDDEXK nuclease domain-containing protein [Prevotella sp.]MCI6448358.1 PDDEXK nuclease domain-containing protein [Prevotella sp.]MCI6509513.1 PDDEXK nuclease domain-containing protein [Prevotella sp.]MCI7268777.1 PDDEXK nuclease domain-containing protein [Prevotella sp.]MDD7068242.1 PDDEXK nuclease domain-containing protein [Prevotella sp.]
MENEISKIDKLFLDVKQIIDEGRRQGSDAISAVICMTNWRIGRRIILEEQHGETRAEYGKAIINSLSKKLVVEYGNNKSISPRDLRNYRQFYLTFRDFEIWYARVPNLNWTHYRSLLRVQNEDARKWYLAEASKEHWSTRTLDRNINSQYYFRLLQSPKKDAVVAEMKSKTVNYDNDRLEFLKNPIVAEFLGLSQNNDFTETKLETAIIDHLQKFIMELGKGYAFVARQQLIRTDLKDYYIDLVFYNYILKCFLLVDLKTSEITHQDIGQMDMYIRMYDNLKCTDGDNPTIGLLLCAETSKDLARYSILHDNAQLFATKYLTYLPKREDLIAEIEQQKEFFELQEKEKNKK